MNRCVSCRFLPAHVRWRGRSLKVVLVSILGLLSSVGYGQEPRGPEPNDIITGDRVPGLESYDRIIAQLLHDHDVPGGAVAVVRYGRLVYARGFGLADREAGAPVQPDAIFRLASVSKPITAVAALKLVEDGKLDLDARVFRDLLTEIGPHRASDLRTNSITVRDLLRHSGGFDWARSGDPQFMQREIARGSRESTPLDCVDIITYMKSQRLDFAPGDRHAYSNYGYCVLGRVIERASGSAYEDYVREEILIPAGAVRMRVADPFLSGRIANEVKYYDYPGAARSRSLDPEVRSRVARPYDGFLSTMDAHGGWAGSVVDVLRFVVAVDGRGDDDVISADSIDVMIAPQRLPPFEQGPVWYGLGWMVRDLGNGESNWWHAGGMPGTSSLVVRAGNGFSWAAAMNSRPENADEFHLALDIAMWEAFQQATRWPRHDLFPQFE